MAFRNLREVRYIPLLTLRPAEMQALEELPDHDKSLLMPFFHLGPWTTAHHLSSALSRLEEAYGDRPCFLTLAEQEPGGSERPVHQQLAILHDPTNGYDAWCTFIEGQVNFVPALQLADISQLTDQASRLHALNRGLLVSMERPAFGGIAAVAERVATVTAGGTNVCFFLDFGRGNRDLLGLQLATIGYARTILERAPNAHIAISASSFPDSFTSIDRQQIFERTLFNGVAEHIGERLIYSDRGSARAERQTGGGGTPAPRIDYAQEQQWTFFRSDDQEDRVAAYSAQAQQAMAADEWDPRLRIWGTQMIERTALGDRSAIISPKRATAARINIHLHRQLFYGDSAGLYNTDDEWTD